MPIRQIDRIRTPTKEQVSEALEALSEGVPLSTIGKVWGVSEKSVYNILGRAKRFGFQVFNESIYLEV